MEKFDFSGWATKANVRCSDGRTILPDAFKHMDGVEVPLVWNHQHNDPNNVLGKVLLENKSDGVYAYGSFNNTDSGRAAKALVEHGDVNALSIWANQLQEHMKSVKHGTIREVSLVLAGANPEARIENVALMHGDEMYEYEDEAYIYSGEYISLSHSAEEDKKSGSTKDETDEEDSKKEDSKKEDSNNEDSKKKEPKIDESNYDEKEEKKGEDEMTDKKKKDDVVPAEEKSAEEAKKEENKTDNSEKGETIADVINTLNDKQKKAFYAVVGMALKGDDETDNENKEDEGSEGGKKDMKHNVFDQSEQQNDAVLSHAEMTEIFEDAKRCGSLKEAFLAHNITDIDVMFPDAKNVTNEPGFVKREDSWVTDVLSSVHHTPFARIKTLFADITAEEARAKGYVKGNLKVEEVFRMLKRVTNPTTIYKKQKLDRDDMIDITDFDVVSWLKTEMRGMLNEEIARAVLVGDGRTSDDDDKINEENIRPIWTDSDLFTVKAAVNVSASATNDEKAKAFIRTCVKSRKNYKGSGNPVMYISEDMLTDCLLIEDTNGRVIYDSMEKLATALRVRKIVPVTVMENLTRTVESKTHTLAGIYVNLNDYNIGANKGGEVSMFDDFDIDYNAQKYLMETRCSGALIKPYAAVAIEFVSDAVYG